MKPYRVHTKVVIDMATGNVLEDKYYYSTVTPAKCEGAAAAIAIIGIVIGGMSAMESASQQAKQANYQKSMTLSQGMQNQALLGFQRKQYNLEYQAAIDGNAYQREVNNLETMKYGLLLQQISGMEEYYGVLGAVAAEKYALLSEVAAQRYALQGAMYGMQAELINVGIELAGQRYALEKTVYDWQLATLDWEADFKDMQAEFLDQKGALAQEVFGVETAKIIARQRAIDAASGIRGDTGSPVEVLGRMKGEREFASDIMQFESDIGVWEKKVEALQTRNEKNRVKFGEYGSALDYTGTLADFKYKAGMAAADYAGAGISYAESLGMAGLDFRETNARIRQDLLESGLKKTEVGGMLSLARSKGVYLGKELSRIEAGNVIDLNRYKTLRSFGTNLMNIQSGYYSAAASGATVGGYLNVGASVFNGISTYYNIAGKNNNYSSSSYGSNYYSNHWGES